MSKQMQLYKMRRIIIYIHGKGGNAEEANHYRSLFPESDVIGLTIHHKIHGMPKMNFRVFLIRAARLTMRSS